MLRHFLFWEQNCMRLSREANEDAKVDAEVDVQANAKARNAKARIKENGVRMSSSEKLRNRANEYTTMESTPLQPIAMAWGSNFVYSSNLFFLLAQTVEEAMPIPIAMLRWSGNSNTVPSGCSGFGLDGHEAMRWKRGPPFKTIVPSNEL
jgi:hypothetical protein